MFSKLASKRLYFPFALIGLTTQALIMPIKRTTNSPALSAILQHLAEVIDFLQQTDSKTNETEFQPFSLLLIGESTTTDTLSEHLQHAYTDMQITTLKSDEFITAAFDTRYTLGCYIEPQLLDNQTFGNQKGTLEQEDTLEANVSQSLKSIAIRLRDLFAEQSVMFLSPLNSRQTLSGLGYILASAPVKESADASSDNETQILCWQFNLYDYKQRPDWLNAKYWANPENFDKYRW